jgi:hypothetical protein
VQQAKPGAYADYMAAMHAGRTRFTSAIWFKQAKPYESADQPPSCSPALARNLAEYCDWSTSAAAAKIWKVGLGPKLIRISS